GSFAPSLDSGNSLCYRTQPLRGDRGRHSGRIAQLVEQLTLNQRVPGSSPGAPTNKINHLNSRVALDLPKIRCWEGHGKIGRRMTVKVRATTSGDSSTKACFARLPCSIPVLTAAPKH